MTLSSQSSEADQSSQKSIRQVPRGVWLRSLVIAGLITVSVILIMICPCDLPWREPIAPVLLLCSLAACLAAAFVLFHVRQFARNSQPILRAAASIGIVIAVRYVELKLAIDCVAWLAGHSR